MVGQPHAATWQRTWNPSVCCFASSTPHGMRSSCSWQPAGLCLVAFGWRWLIDPEIMSVCPSFFAAVGLETCCARRTGATSVLHVVWNAQCTVPQSI